MLGRWLPFLLAFWSLQVCAQTPEEALREKLASPFLKRARWHLELADALAEAKKRDRLVFAYLTTTGP